MAGDVGTRADNPTLDAEARLWAQGLRCVAGLDEAGRGALAGPVVAAAVVVPPDAGVAGVWSQVRDSKLLTPPRRAALAAEVTAAAWAGGVGVVTAAVEGLAGAEMFRFTARSDPEKRQKTLMPAGAEELLRGNPEGGVDARGIQPFYTGILARMTDMELSIGIDNEFFAFTATPKAKEATETAAA